MIYIYYSKLKINYLISLYLLSYSPRFYIDFNPVKLRDNVKQIFYT